MVKNLFIERGGCTSLDEWIESFGREEYLDTAVPIYTFSREHYEYHRNWTQGVCSCQPRDFVENISIRTFLEKLYKNHDEGSIRALAGRKLNYGYLRRFFNELRRWATNQVFHPKEQYSLERVRS